LPDNKKTLEPKSNQHIDNMTTNVVELKILKISRHLYHL